MYDIINSLKIKLLFTESSIHYNCIYKHLSHIIKFNNENEANNNFLSENDKKLFYHVKVNSYKGILRPEFTYLANIDLNINSKDIFYIGYCFRSERKQFLRFNEFEQLGIEMYARNNVNKFTKIAKLLNQLEYFFSNFKIINNKAEFYYNINNLSQEYEENINNLVKNMCLKLNFTPMFDNFKRFGGINNIYTEFYFELIIKHNNRNIELLGGGTYNYKYKDNIIYCCGYSIGLERLMNFFKLF